MGRKVVCNNDLRQQRETKLTVNIVYKAVAWKQKAKSGEPVVSKLTMSCYKSQLLLQLGRLWLAHTLGSGMWFRKTCHSMAPSISHSHPAYFFIHETGLAQWPSTGFPKSLGIHTFLGARSPFKGIKFQIENLCMRSLLIQDFPETVPMIQASCWSPCTSPFISVLLLLPTTCS